MRKSPVHKKEVIEYLLRVRKALKHNPIHEKLYNQIPDVVEYIKSHDILFDNNEAGWNQKLKYLDVMNSLVRLAKIINTIWDLINGNNSTSD